MYFPEATVEELEQVVLEGICISTVMIDSISSRAKNLKKYASANELITLDLIQKN